MLEQAPHVLAGTDMGRLYTYLEIMLHPSGQTHGRHPLTRARRDDIHAHYAAQNRDLVAGFMPGVTYDDAFGEDATPHEQDVSDDLARATARTLAYVLDLLRKQHGETTSLRNRVAKLEAAQERKGRS